MTPVYIPIPPLTGTKYVIALKKAFPIVSVLAIIRIRMPIGDRTDKTATWATIILATSCISFLVIIPRTTWLFHCTSAFFTQDEMTVSLLPSMSFAPYSLPLRSATPVWILPMIAIRLTGFVENRKSGLL